MMGMPLKTKPGDRFGKLTVIEQSEYRNLSNGKRMPTFLVQCDCGSPPRICSSATLLNGSSKSCGCIRGLSHRTHGMSKTRQYQCWVDMIRRCDDETKDSYNNYGELGITYDPKWATFEGFWEDMSEGYSDDLTLNRVNPYLGYCKENCNWANSSVQQHAKRKLKNTSLKSIGTRLWASGKYTACITINKKKIGLGKYLTETEAMEAYDHASEKLYGDRPNHTTETRQEIVEYVNIQIQVLENTC